MKVQEQAGQGRETSRADEERGQGRDPGSEAQGSVQTGRAGDPAGNNTSAGLSCKQELNSR